MKPSNLLKEILDPFRVFAALMLAVGLWLVPVFFRAEPQPVLASPLRKDCRVCVDWNETCNNNGCHSQGCAVWVWEPCEGDDPPPPSPPTVSSTVSCTVGDNGWCVDNARLIVSASDPQGYALTITGSAGGTPISCGGNCAVNLPPGSGTAAYTATAAVSGLSASGSKAWWYDPSPPDIFISAAGNQAQDGWFSTAVDLSATASDALSGLNGSVSLSFDNGATWEVGPRTLGDGLYDALFRVSDYAGNIGTSQMSLKIDTQPPTIALSKAGSLGQDGWYVSAATLSADVGDNLSGVVSIRHRVNGGEWQEGDSVTVQEGVHMVDFQAFDAAGNIQSTSREIRVDTSPPAYSFNAGLDGSVLAETVNLSGTVSDQTSGAQSVEFSSDGTNWLPVLFLDTNWDFTWDSSVFDNGDRNLFLRATDMAGNQGQPIRVRVILDNDPPYVKLAETWNVWEGGDLTVFNNVIPLESIRIVVHDPMLRFADQVIDDKLPAPSVVVWDRVIGPASAPPGSYTVTVEVCDIYGLCSKDTGMIVIPDSPTPEPVPIPTQPAEPKRWWSLPVAIPRQPVTETEQPSIVPVVVVPIQEDVQVVPSFPLWTMVVISAFLLSFVLLLLLDPRPKAWRSLTRRIAESLNPSITNYQPSRSNK